MSKPVPRQVTMAAQLQVKVDQKRGIDTPEVIRKLAHAAEFDDDDVAALREAIAVR